MPQAALSLVASRGIASVLRYYVRINIFIIVCNKLHLICQPLHTFHTSNFTTSESFPKRKNNTNNYFYLDKFNINYKNCFKKNFLVISTYYQRYWFSIKYLRRDLVIVSWKNSNIKVRRVNAIRLLIKGPCVSSSSFADVYFVCFTNVLTPKGF